MKQKKYFVGFLIVLLVIGFGIWLSRDSGEADLNNFSKNLDEGLRQCEGAATNYVRLSEPQAADKANKEKREYRVVKRDGEGLPQTQDYNPDRLNFEVEKGVVAKVTCG